MIKCLFKILEGIILYLYEFIQLFISVFFSPLPPTKDSPRIGHVAVIGAGITGISTAAHLRSHGFEVTIFDESPDIGGIWRRVNSTSNLQINSLFYRFHPLAFYRSFYPFRDEILAQQHKVLTTYGLDKCIRFNTRVTKIERHSSSSSQDSKIGGPSRWIVNGNKSEVFDGLVVTIGTCGKPRIISLPNQDQFKGKIIHSCELDYLDYTGKSVVVIGGAASGVEVAETAVAKGAKKATILARSDKWFIPRNVILDSCLSMFPYIFKTLTTLVPEQLIRRLHYRDLEEKMTPTFPLYSSTPVVNNAFFRLVREGSADYHRGEVTSVKSDGLEWNYRLRSQRKAEEGEKKFINADIIVLASGYHRPSMDFLPKDLFPDGYSSPNMYLQCFPVHDPSIVCTNATYVDGFGSVGSLHIGIYARLLALFLRRPETRPSSQFMRFWVDTVRIFKRGFFGGPLEFFTYPEVCIWLAACMLQCPERIPYFFFVMFGFGEWYVAKDGSSRFRYPIMNFWSRIMKQLHRLPLERPQFYIPSPQQRV